MNPRAGQICLMVVSIVLLLHPLQPLQVKEIIDDTHLLGTCLNPKALGQRKNCNLPGVIPSSQDRVWTLCRTCITTTW